MHLILRGQHRTYSTHPDNLNYLRSLMMKDYIKNGIAHIGITKLNEMQERTFQHFEKENRLLLLSPTGSGKTLAFLLPLLNSLHPDMTGHVQALVLAPSRELALQIENVMKSLKTGFKVNCCYGGHPMSIEKNNLKHPPAILIGTPGRIGDHLRRKTFDPSYIRTLVIDEFDKSLELGFREEMGFIIETLTGLRKKMFTSATQATEIPEFTGMQDHFLLDFLPKDASENTSKLIVKKVDPEGPVLDTLFRLLCELSAGPVLVFCNFKEKVEEVSQYLERKGLHNTYFHGGLEQHDREKALAMFRNGSVQVLVTSDLASRGLDIPEIRNIIHLQMPPHEDAFIHRNGRTARMNASGAAFILPEKSQSLPDYLPRHIETYTLATNPAIPAPPAWTTLYISKGKKHKVNKIDIVGFLGQKGSLKKEDIGLIEVKDYFSYVAVRSSLVQKVLRLVRDEKIKNQQAKIEVCK